MDFPRHKNSAFTMVEALVSMGVAGILVAAVSSLLLLFSRSSSTILNCSVVNARDRNSLEIIGRDIREADSFLVLGPKSISLLLSNQTVNLVFNPADRRLRRISAGTNEVLLPNCQALQFKYFQRDTNAAHFENLLVSTSANCRVIEMNWNSLITSNGAKAVTVSNSVRFLNRRAFAQ